MKVKIICQDRNEAAKLASLIFIKDGNETFISTILNVYGNEIVISLKDHSAHAVVLKDSKQVETFVDFIQSVIDKNDRITDTNTHDDTVEIAKC